MGGLDVDTERAGQRDQAAAGRQRGEPAGERDRAQDRRGRPRQPGCREGALQRAAIEARVVGHEHPAGEPGPHLGQHGRRRRGVVDHRLGDAGQPLHAARQRATHADQGREPVVQFAAADEHQANLGQLLRLSGQAVGLDVNHHELGRGERGALQR